MAVLIIGLLNHPDSWHDEAKLRKFFRLANAVGALTTTQRGAIPSLPTKRQVKEFLDPEVG